MIECYLVSGNDYDDVTYHFAGSGATLEEGISTQAYVSAVDTYLFLVIAPPCLARRFVRRYGPMSNNTDSAILVSEANQYLL